MDLPAPKDLSHHLSRITQRRMPSKVKQFYKYFLVPGMANLAGGLPNASYFPYDTLEANVAIPNRFRPTAEDPADLATGVGEEKTSKSTTDAAHVLVPHDAAEPNILRKIDLTSALQYGTAQGYPALYSFLKEFTLTKLHPSIPYKGGADIVLTCGSTDGFKKVIDAFHNSWDWERDWIKDRESMLLEEFAYMAPIQEVKPRGMNVVAVAMDDEGMMADGPGGLADVLANWDTSKGKLPHLMYTVTMGQNPTSGLLSLARRRKIYALCQQYDILIIEDDPYWYLQYPSAVELSIKHRGHSRMSSPFNVEESGRKSSGSPFLDSLVPSYLSIDVDGRVLRLDTFSKTVAPGCRLGWITAQPAFIERLTRITETSTQQPSGFVQSLVAELILGPSHGTMQTSKVGGSKPTGWQMDGWIRWLEGLRGNYERRMQVMSQILENGKYVVRYNKRRGSSGSTTDDDFEIISKTQMYDFTFPMAGMFLWLKCFFDTHPLYEKVDHRRLSRALWLYLASDDYKVMVAPGSMFAASEAIEHKNAWQYFRICFAAIAEEGIESSSHRFVDGMTAFWEIDTVKEIDDLLKDEEGEDTTDLLAKLALDPNNNWMINPATC